MVSIEVEAAVETFTGPFCKVCKYVQLPKNWIHWFPLTVAANPGVMQHYAVLDVKCLSSVDIQIAVKQKF